MSEGLRLALIGVILGSMGAAGLTRFLKGMLFEVSVTDPAAYGIIAVLFVILALGAAYIPARRAASVDPMVAIR